MTARLVPRDRLTFAERAAMFALLDAHFVGVTRDRFDGDLAEKNWAVLVERNAELVGFSTIKLFEADVDGQALTVVSSGDTIVSPAVWGSAAFPRAWIDSVYQLRRLHPGGRFIWLLLTSGYRTYRFLPVFWKEFYPRHDMPTPPSWQRLLNQLAEREWGPLFDAERRLVRFDQPQLLRGPLAEVPAGREVDPHVAFFLSRNPAHDRGDELVCVADLSPEHLTAAGRRVVYGTLR